MTIFSFFKKTRFSDDFKKHRILLGCSVGNLLEFYDFALNGIFITLISKMFFPQGGIYDTFIGGIAAFSISYLSRPIGAVLFGCIGDLQGRSYSLGISLIFMSIPTLIIAFLPTYHIIGYGATFILLFCRFIQGVCIGGEYNGAVIFALENFPMKKGFIAGILCASSVTGALLATTLGVVVQNSSNPEFYFRMLYAFGAVVAFVGHYFRKLFFIRKAKKIYNKSGASYRVLSNFFREVITQYKVELFLVLCIGSMNGALSYALLSFITIYLHKLVGVDQNIAFYASLLHLLMATLFSPVFGWLSDKLGNQKYIMLNLLTIPFASFFVFHLISEGDLLLTFLGQAIMGLIVASYIGPSFVYYQDILPNSVKSTGISLGCSLGMSLTAGLWPLILLYQVSYSNNLMIPAYYLATLSFIVLGVISYVQKNKSKRVKCLQI